MERGQVLDPLQPLHLRDDPVGYVTEDCAAATVTGNAYVPICATRSLGTGHPRRDRISTPILVTSRGLRLEVGERPSIARTALSKALYCRLARLALAGRVWEVVEEGLNDAVLHREVNHFAHQEHCAASISQGDVEGVFKLH